MVIWVSWATVTRRAGISLAIAGLWLGGSAAAQAQDTLGRDSSLLPQLREAKQRPLPDRLPEKPSVAPVFTIPVEPLGFTAPSVAYLGFRRSMASLDFLDENRLLFTFRVPGLMRREGGDGEGTDERQIRAVVVALPDGKVEAEALWTLHDQVRYLWMLKDGQFLLRDRDILQQGDAKLEMKPLLQFPGSLFWLELDPTQQFMVTNSREPVAATTAKADDRKPSLLPDAGQADAKPQDPPRTELVLRVLHRESGRVLLVSRVQATVHLPINSDGYLETLRGNGEQWVLNLNYFGGGSRLLGRVDSTCSPGLDFVSQQEVLVTGCTKSEGRKLVAMDIAGRLLWQNSTSASVVWPLLVMGPDGSRLAQETLVATHAVNALEPLNREDVKGQLIRVFDAADGKLALEAQASPALDAGGNVAISPSGRRVAILNAGAIQVFELPASHPVANPSGNQTVH
jgi:hypothetical protein